MKQSSGRQRDYALAMGIESDAQTDGDALSEAMNQAKVSLKGPPNQRQKLLAERWGVEVGETDTGWDLVGRLYPIIKARSFVYSVVRRLVNARWQYHEESGLNPQWIDYLAMHIASTPDLCEQVVGMENTLSGTMADAWYRFGKRQWECEAVQFVVDAAYRADVPSQFAPKPPKTKGCSGCLVMAASLLIVAWIVLWAAWI